MTIVEFPAVVGEVKDEMLRGFPWSPGDSLGEISERGI
jgi:hypothetical protein